MEKSKVCGLLLINLFLPLVQNQLTPQRINEILSWDPPAHLKNHSYFLSGYDIEGSPVYIVEVGKWNVMPVTQGELQQKELLYRLAQQFAIRASEAGMEYPGLGSIVILDLEGAEGSHWDHPEAQDYIHGIVGSWEQYHQGKGLKKQYIINAGPKLTNSFKRRKFEGLVGDITQIYGQNSLEWQEDLLKQINPDQLPHKYRIGREHRPLRTFPEL